MTTPQLEAELAEYKASFELRWKADMRAIERWRGNDPAKELILPDHADLCVWLLSEVDRLRAVLDKISLRAPSAVARAWAHDALYIEEKNG